MPVISAFLALLLPCAGIGAVFAIYIGLLWYTARGFPSAPAKYPASKGISPSDLEKLPVSKGVLGGDAECAVCLDVMEAGRSVRILPACEHAFHLSCVDAWLAQNAVCPICRSKLELAATENGPPEANCSVEPPFSL